MKHSGGIKVDAVITGTRPVTVTVDHRNINGQEPQNSLHIQDRFNGLGQISGRCFIEHPAEINQGLPGILLVLGLDFKSLTIGVYVLTQITKPSISLGTAGNFPSCPGGGAVIFL